jgi:hypothetical protein
VSDKTSVVGGGRLLGFFSLLLLLTLNADNGNDLLDATVDWVQSKATVNMAVANNLAMANSESLKEMME